MPNLFLVPASALGDKARRTAILSSPEFAGLIADLREAFDYVIIDVPAISEARSYLPLRPHLAGAAAAERRLRSHPWGA